MSVIIATMGMYTPPGGGTIIYQAGGMGGGISDERRRLKPVVKINKIKYDKYMEKTIKVISIEEY